MGAKMWQMVILPSLILVVSAALTTAQDCTPKPTDIVFVLDESGSVGDDNFKIQNEFVAKFVDGFNIGKDTNQVAVVTFSSDVVVEFYLNEHHDKAELMDHIKHINYSHIGLTLTHKALSSVRTDVLTAGKGRRPDALPVVIVMTDGRSMSKFLTGREAKKLHDMNVTVFAIGITKEIREDELYELATDSKNVILVQDFDALMSVRKQTVSVVCDGVNKRVYGSNYSPTTPTTTVQVSLDIHSNFTCDFEDEYLCGFSFQLPKFNQSWIIGNATNVPGIEPHLDNTFQNISGQFPFVDGRTIEPNNSAFIFTPMINFHQTSAICLQFYFQMFGNDTKTLKVYTTNSTTQRSLMASGLTPIWAKTTNHTLGWKKAEVRQITNSNSSQRVVFEASNITKENGIAIDDISLWYCPDSIGNPFKQAPAGTTNTTPRTTTATTIQMSPTATIPYSSTENWYQTDSSSNIPPQIMTKVTQKITKSTTSTTKTPLTTTTKTTTPTTTTTKTTTPTTTTTTKTTTATTKTTMPTTTTTMTTTPTTTTTKTTTPTTTTAKTTTPTTTTMKITTPTTTKTKKMSPTTTYSYSSTDSGYWIDSSSMSATFSTDVQKSYPFTSPPVKPPTSLSLISSTRQQIQHKTSKTIIASSTQGTNIMKNVLTTKIHGPRTTIRANRTPTKDKNVSTLRSTLVFSTKRPTNGRTSEKTTARTTNVVEKLTSKPFSHLQTHSPRNSSGASKFDNLSNFKQTRYLLPGFFQYIEIALISVTAIVAIGLLGCCCFKFCAAKRSEDDDEEENEKKKAAEKDNQDNNSTPILKSGGWIKGLQF